MHAHVAFWLMLFLGAGAIHGQLAMQILHPEEIAGRWEASDGKGGYVGMNVLLSTTIPTTAQLSNAPQSYEHLEIGLYRRSGSDASRLVFHFFVVPSEPVAMWNGRNLRVNLPRSRNDSEVHLDLRWDSTHRSWSGVYHYANFRNPAITLKRPQAPKHNPFVGTWLLNDELMNNCLHIAQANDGTFAAWSDDLQVPAQMHYANGLKQSDHIFERYGEIARAHLAEPNRIEVELRAFTPMCCSHPFSATISKGGNSLAANWLPRMNQAPAFATWTRVAGDSCIAVSRR